MPRYYLNKRKKGLLSTGRQNVASQPIVRQKQPVQTNLTGKTGNAASLMKGTIRNAVRSSQGAPQETATQRAERERSERMRNGLSSIVRSQASRNFANKTYVNKSSLRPIASAMKHNPLLPTSAKTVTGGHGIGEQRTFSKLRSFRQPASEVAKYTRGQQYRYATTPSMDVVPAQDRTGRINTEYGNKLRAGMPSTNTAIMSWRSDPTQKEREYRDRYGYTKKMEEALDRRLNDKMMEASYSPTTGEIRESKNGRAFSAGHTDALARENVEDTVNRQFGIKPDDDTLAKIEAQRNSFNYGAGTAVGQMEQYALTRGLLGTAGLVGNGTKAAKGVKGALKAMGVEAGIDQLASVPMNIVDALKADSTGETIDRFIRNQKYDLVFSGVMEFVPFFKNKSVREDIQKAFNLHTAAKKETNEATKEILEKKVGNILDATKEDIQKEVDNIVANGTQSTAEKTVEKQTVPEYNTNGGIDNGAEPRQRTDVEGTVGEVQRQPDSIADVESGGRRPEGQPASDSGNNRRLLLDDKQDKLFNDNNVARTGIKETDSPSFISSITENSKSQKYGACVDIPEEKHLRETGAKLYSSADGSGTVAVTKDGDIIALSKRKGAANGTTDELLLTAIARGGKKMDAFGKELANLYSGYGFEPVGRVEFNPAIYADEPDKLAVFKQLAVDGKEGPDVYVFKHNGDDLETVIKKNRNDEYKTWSQEELDKLPVFEDSVDGEKTIYGYDKALEYRDNLMKPKESPKDALGRDVFNGQGERYHPSGAGKTERGWKSIERKYEKHSIAWLRKEKTEGLSKKIAKGMDSSEATERMKLIDSLLDEKQRYRYGTLKEYNGEKISQSFDTLSHSEKTELLHDAMRASFIDNGAGRKIGMNPDEAIEAAVTRIEKNADDVKSRLIKAAGETKQGSFPKDYKNSQEFYAEVIAYLEHNNSKMQDLIDKGLKDSEEYNILKRDGATIIDGAGSLRTQEGYGAVTYNVLCHSNGDMRVATVQKAVDEINEQFEKQLEKAAKQAGKELSDAEKIKVVLTDDMIDRIKKVNKDSPLEMNRVLNDISREIWNQVPASGREIWDSVRKTAMLLNPKTHERNFIGNSLMIPARLIKDAIGAPLEKHYISKGKMDIIDASKARINRFSTEYKERAKAARQIWEEWKDFVTGSAKYFDNTTPTASKLLGKRPIGGWNKLLTAGIENPKMWRKVGDAVMGFNGWLLEKSDELFLKFHFVDSLVQVSKARNLDLSNLTSEEMQSLIKTATGEAQRATFRDVSEAAKLINELKTVNPKDGKFKKAVSWTVDTDLPFVNVPINVGRRAWDYSPLGLVEGLTTINKGIKNGDSKQVKKAIDKIASGTTGTGIFIVGALLGRNGGATATLSSGKRGYYEQDQGNQEYSINIEGEDGIDIPFIELKNEDGISVSLSPFAPWSIPFFAGVEAGNALDGGKVNWSALLDAVGGALAPMLDMSVLQGPADVLNSIRKSEDAPAMVVNLILTTLTNHYMQYVPTIMGQIARVQDPVRRDTTSYQENSVMKNLDKTKLKFISKIPSTPLTDNSLYNISSTRLNPYLDAWGREQRTFEDNKAARFAYEFFSPTYAKQKNITALDKEINRLNDLAANEDEYVIPTKSFNTALSLNGDKVQLDRNDIYEYNKVKGTESYKKASKLIETDEYLSATPEEQRKMLNKVFGEAGTEAKRQTLLAKGIDEYKVYTDGFTGGKAEQVENARAAGINAKDYNFTLTDKAADANGNGSYSKSEFYDYLLKQKQYNNQQRAILMAAKDKSWAGDKNPFITGEPPKGSEGTTTASNANYTDSIKSTGLSEEQFNQVMSSDQSKIDVNGSGRVSQDEYQAYLDSFDFLTNEQKSAIWKQYNTHWKRNPYDGTTASSSGGRRRSRSGRKSGGGSSKSKARAKTETEKRFTRLQNQKLSSIDYGKIYADNKVKVKTPKTNTSEYANSVKMSSVKGLSKSQKKALLKLMQKKLEV